MNHHVKVYQLANDKTYLNVINEHYSGVGVWGFGYKVVTILITKGWNFELLQFSNQDAFEMYLESRETPLDFNTMLILTEEGWKPYETTN